MKPHRLAKALPLEAVNLHDAFWSRYVKLVHERVIPYQWEALNDRVPGAEKSHAIENFRIAAGLASGDFHGYVFQDSDLYKWLEAVAYRLATHPDAALEAQADAAIALIGQAQQSDGYLNTHYTVAQPGKRWTDERRKHELYCAGHLVEAAVAYAEATGKRALLEIACRFVDHTATVFGPAPNQKHGYPGHQVLEMALVKLFHLTGEARHLALASYFIDERGKQPHFYDLEEAARGEKGHLGYFEDYVYAYTQAHAPVREQKVATGHAVRAVYLYSGMADVAMETGDESLAQACRTLWANLTRRQMYITGAIGSQEYGEDFTFDFDLPNDTMYAETCAAIGLVFFAHRMLQMEPRGAYADVMERALYNGVLSGISQDGERFFYVNPLEVWPEACTGRHDHRHVAATRQPWFGCACCPPNIARLIASIGRYLCTQSEDTLWIHLYAGSDLTAQVAGRQVHLRLHTVYPADGQVRLEMVPEASCTFTLALRIPGWCRTPRLSVKGIPVDLATCLSDGYVYLRRTWEAGDLVDLDLPMPVERLWSHPSLRADAGQVALQRGPVVYCLEEVDNGGNLGALSIPRNAELAIGPDAYGLPTVEGTARRLDEARWREELYAPEPPASEPCHFRAVPYHTWGNRGPGEMRVWIREYP